MPRAAANPAVAPAPPPSLPSFRFRVMAFGRPIGPWRARRALAQQDAVEAGHASREWDTGLVYKGPGVVIITEPGEAPITQAEQRQAQALAFHRRHGGGALTRAATKQAAYHAAGEADASALWAEVVEELKTIRAEALRADRPSRA